MRVLNRISTFFVLVFAVTSANAALPSVDENGKPFPSLAPMLKEVNPGVVNISTFSTQTQAYNPLLNDPFFRRFFNIPDQGQLQQAPQKRKQSAGSGVIVDAENGIVLSNSHVIKNADEVHVSLVDGRSFEATIKGADPDLDIAVLEIDAEDLTEVSIADSSSLEVGDFVIAIGNPFGLGQTVTTGIVSALGRSGLGIDGYESFIQTDASINPGNSGGALVNLNGELVGINTAIIAPAGGNVGIGFAIPVNMAKSSMDQIVAYGEVRRGKIGIGIQDVTSNLREAFALEPGQQGVLVSSVDENSPAKIAGVQSGDVVLAVDGQPTQSTGQLRSRIGSKKVGDSVALSILRDGNELEISVEIGEPHALAQNFESVHPLLEGAQFENDPKGDGIRIAAVQQGSRAAYSGLKPGDVIIGANRKRVSDTDSLADALSVDSSSALLQVRRDGGSFFVVIS